MQNNLVFSLSKCCEDLVKEDCGEAAQIMANLMGAHAALRMRGAINHDRLDPTIDSWISEIQQACIDLVGDAMTEYPPCG